MTRPAVAFVSWTRSPGRAEEIAAALGGEAFHSWSPGRPLVRYARSSLATAGYLLRRRPRAVVVTNPPVVPCVLVRLYAALARAPFALDSHPTAFGAKDHTVSRRLMPVHHRLARAACAVLVTEESRAAQVDGWGGHGVVVHEAPSGRAPAAPPRGDRPCVLFVGVFASDEPVDAVLEAASRLPEADVFVTGDPRRLDPRWAGRLPANVRLVGYADADAYADLVAAADVVLSLTTEPTSVMRSAYEAVYAERPLVVSDWPVLRRTFPHAQHVASTGAGIAEGVRRVLDDLGAARRAAGPARRLQLVRWEQQRRALAVALGLPVARVGGGRAEVVAAAS